MAKNPDHPKKPGKTPKSKAHRPDVARHVTAVETADLSALTQRELEAIAKRHMVIVED